MAIKVNSDGSFSADTVGEAIALSQQLSASQPPIAAKASTPEVPSNPAPAESQPSVKKPFSRRGWSDEEERRLIYARNNGVSIREIAKILRRTEGAVNARLQVIQRAGESALERKRVVKSWTPEEKQLLVEGYREGLSSTELGAMLDRTPEAIRSRIYRLQHEGSTNV